MQAKKFKTLLSRHIYTFKQVAGCSRSFPTSQSTKLGHEILGRIFAIRQANSLYATLLQLPTQSACTCMSPVRMCKPQLHDIQVNACQHSNIMQAPYARGVPTSGCLPCNSLLLSTALPCSPVPHAGILIVSEARWTWAAPGVVGSLQARAHFSSYVHVALLRLRPPWVRGQKALSVVWKLIAILCILFLAAGKHVSLSLSALQSRLVTYGRCPAQSTPDKVTASACLWCRAQGGPAYDRATHMTPLQTLPMVGQ